MRVRLAVPDGGVVLTTTRLRGWRALRLDVVLFLADESALALILAAERWRLTAADFLSGPPGPLPSKAAARERTVGVLSAFGRLLNVLETSEGALSLLGVSCALKTSDEAAAAGAKLR
jgi:hypothetical protein